MSITKASDFPKAEPRYQDQWGPWKFQVSGLKNVNVDYLIPWTRISHGTDVLAWIIQLSNKNRTLYGITVVQDLVDAFKDVLGLCMMNDAAKTVHGLQKAKEYQQKLKQQALSPSFGLWLASQVNQQDAIGDLAKDFLLDCRLSKVDPASYATARSLYMSQSFLLNASDQAKRALRSAEKKYMDSIK